MKEVACNPVVPGQPLGFNLLRVPFFLEPAYPTDEEFEETNRLRLIRKWGGQAGWNAQKKHHRLKERGQEVGIQHFNLDRIASNTLASHRLVQWITRTMGTNCAERLYNTLNEKHFVEGVKLNDREMLVEVAESVGADPFEIRRFLEGTEGISEIRQAQQMLSEIGVSGIPTCILGGRWQLPSGAIGSATLIEAFRMIEIKGGAVGSLFAEALSIPPHVLEETLVLA
mmetsp:Transcript_51776/g.85887  ORF Transcript_51776/g.85887 Transcript_51776/m.85887 type:complete len:227 (+) Transcript_51776:171-851(+)|eukprot:CAMPEP_0119333468 /NCGR_PEP_ID=MMETSP1333-20130426/85231_1 /TAXON_ID=418940 /ORGANISM="Scyphosphaera apsteinii, Strain RCC1455" /LENGTH=226 /DNA_ID=CAMNT_0007343543 /DNA_START=160 /DNA_END=840 /DNA_ORIENTATION=-